MKIVADCMGADLGPAELLKGCAAAAAECDIDIIAVGKKEELLKAISENGIDSSRIEIVDAQTEIDMHDPATSVIKEKKDSSMAVAFQLLNEGKADAMVSAGNSGAILAGGTLLVKRIKGINRAAFAPIMPSKTGHVMIIDSGANTECTASYLNQFGIMGSVYMEQAEKVENPRVGLANNGSEDTKGTDLYKEAHKLLKENKSINFIGNIEGRGIMLGECDVVVCDGFVGNLVLKTIEGMGVFMIQSIKDLFLSGFHTKIAALLLKKDLGAFKKKMDYKEIGGAVLLGVNKPVVKAHGNSDARGFKGAIRQAKRFAEGDVISRIEEKLKAIQAAEQQ